MVMRMRIREDRGKSKGEMDNEEKARDERDHTTPLRQFWHVKMRYKVAMRCDTLCSIAESVR